MNGTASAPSTEVERVRRRSAQWLAVVASADVPAIVRYYADDASFLVPNAPLAQGADAIRGMWSALFAAPSLQLNWTASSIEVADGGDMACEIGSYTLRMRPNNVEVEDDGKYVVVWRKHAGEWLVYADIFNSSRAPETR